MVSAARSDWVPRRLGCYDVVGELATGGMAQILLASAPRGGWDEPGTADVAVPRRVVVLKRILPALREDTSIVEMFLDEGRVACSVHHPNIVHVESSEQQDGELYLVMEYLQGETLLGLMRRLRRNGDPLPYALGAYLAAEVCDGLHAAHEVCGPSGRPMGLVHRDVSPHNIFVTYDGRVKMLDFGIAKSADPVARTEVGQLKGKFEYMSPEQYAGRGIDRRADVFALGAVLYELTTGCRLFRRDSEVETVKAVLEEPIVRPSTFLPAYPATLERIMLTALARKPGDRYDNCAQMRRALMRFVREEGSLPGARHEHVSRLMRQLFAEREREKQELVLRVAMGETVERLPSAEVDSDCALPGLSDAIDDATTNTRRDRVGAICSSPSERASARPAVRAVPTNAATEETRPSRPPPRLEEPTSRARAPRGAIPTPSAIHVRPSGLSAKGGAPAPPRAPRSLRVHTQRTWDKYADEAPSHTQLTPIGRQQLARSRWAGLSGPLLVVGVPLALLVASLVVYLIATRQVGDPPAQAYRPALTPVLPDPRFLPAELDAPSEPADEGQPAVVSVHVTSKPAGSRVFIGGELRGRTPLALRFPRSPTPVSYRFELEGYRSVRGTLIPLHDAALSVPMAKRNARPRRAR
ncbi:MAG: protein kinase [Myxococcales bacterium]|nr:protein kinase [Myxococcales bacterium]MDD9967968.1 protein kinase [Myxococcales bacterium]